MHRHWNLILQKQPQLLSTYYSTTFSSIVFITYPTNSSGNKASHYIVTASGISVITTTCFIIILPLFNLGLVLTFKTAFTSSALFLFLNFNLDYQQNKHRAVPKKSVGQA